jgi:hypothetical protein
VVNPRQPPDNLPQILTRPFFITLRIEVNFSSLRKNLKENVENVAETTQKLRSKLEKLEGSLTVAAPSDPKADRTLSRINSELTKVRKSLSDQQTLLAKVEKEFSAVKAQRVKQLQETLVTMNEKVEEFFRITSDGQTIASFELSRDLSDGIAFNRRSIDHDVTEDFTAALAFLFAIFKVNKQNLVILNNATRKITDDIEKFFNAQSDIQVVNFTTLFRDETSNYAVQSKSQGFAVARIN